MHVHDALDRLDAIHAHLARAEVYRGFRVAAVAATGAVGLLAAALQPVVAGGVDGFVAYWVVVAAVGAAVSGGPAAYSYFASEDDLARRRTRLVLGQFAPCVLAGAAITAALMRIGPEVVPALPGVWAVVFGVGLVSARPYLPPAVGWVGAFYLAAGAALLATIGRAEPSPWAVGGVFGPGHLFTALVLARGRTEGDDDA